MSARILQIGSNVLQQVVYGLKVTQQVAKTIYEKEKMSPPSVKELGDAVNGFMTVGKQAVRMVKSKELPQSSQVVSAARVGVELLGFFTIGEIIGRWHIVGYKSLNKH